MQKQISNFSSPVQFCSISLLFSKFFLQNCRTLENEFLRQFKYKHDKCWVFLFKLFFVLHKGDLSSHDPLGSLEVQDRQTYLRLFCADNFIPKKFKNLFLIEPYCSQDTGVWCITHNSTKLHHRCYYNGVLKYLHRKYLEKRM